MSSPCAEILFIEEVLALPSSSTGKSIRVLGRIVEHQPAEGIIRIADKGHELTIDTKLMGGVVTYPKQLWHFVGELELVGKDFCLQARFGKHLEDLNLDAFKKSLVERRQHLEITAEMDEAQQALAEDMDDDEDL
eukprot:m.23470 g.23470  ORF g.23470 m.23470 type:complete len:135 (+) comp11387_c0_seq1:399-803(+)